MEYHGLCVVPSAISVCGVGSMRLWPGRMGDAVGAGGVLVVCWWWRVGFESSRVKWKTAASHSASVGQGTSLVTILGQSYSHDYKAFYQYSVLEQ